MEIYINGEKADFFDDTIQYVLNSPIFQEQGGEAALSLQFPLTVRNRQLFGYAHRPEAKGREEFDVVIKAGGMHKRGTGIVTEAGETYKLNVGFEKSDFFHKLAGKTLRDLPWERVSFEAEPSLQGQSTDTIDWDWNNKTNAEMKAVIGISVSGLNLTGQDDHPGSFDIPNGYSFRLTCTIESEGTEESPYISLYRLVNGEWKWFADSQIHPDVNELFGPVTSPPETRYSTFRATLSLNSKVSKKGMMRLVPDADGITLKAVVFNQNANGSVILDNKPYPQSNYVLGLIYNPSLVSEDDENPDSSSYADCPLVNFYASGMFPATYQYGGAQRTNMYCPFPYVAHVFDLIAAYTGYSIGRNIFKENPEIATLVLYNNFIEVKRGVNEMTGNKPGFEAVLDWDMKKHVSDMELKEFVKVLNLFGVALFADTSTRRIDMIPVQEILTKPIGFSMDTQLSEPVSLGEGFDSYELSFSSGESFAQDQCIDLEKDTYLYLGEKARSPKPLYGDLVKTRDSLHGRGYFLFSQAENMETETNEDGYLLEGLAQNPYSNADEESRNTFSVESPLGPVFAGNVFRFVNKDSIYGFSELDTAEEDYHYMHGRTASYAEDEGLLAGSVEAAEDYPTIGLTFYRGILEDLPTLSHDIYYEKLSSYATEHRVEERIPNANIALKWEGENGLYQTFWKSFLDWLTRQARKAKIRIPVLPVADFMKLKTSYRVRINQQNYLIDTIQADLGDKVTNIEIEAYTC